MQKIGILCLCLSMVLVFGSITLVVGQDTEDEMVVPMGIIVIEAPESVEPKRSPVDFPHSTAYHQMCIGCHKEIKIQNKQLETSFKELKETMTIPGPTGCIQCHPKEE